MPAGASPAHRPLCRAPTRGAPCARWAGGCVSAHAPRPGGSRPAASWGAGDWRRVGGGWCRRRHPLARRGVGCRCGGEAGGGWGRLVAGPGSPAAPQLPLAPGPPPASAGIHPGSLQREGLRDSPRTRQPCSLGPLPPRDPLGTKGPRSFSSRDTQAPWLPSLEPLTPMDPPGTPALSRDPRSSSPRPPGTQGPTDPATAGPPSTQGHHPPSLLGPPALSHPSSLSPLPNCPCTPSTLHPPPLPGAAQGPGRPHGVALTRHWCDEVSFGGDVVVGWAEGRRAHCGQGEPPVTPSPPPRAVPTPVCCPPPAKVPGGPGST